jgi:hypothetical protein
MPARSRPIRHKLNPVRFPARDDITYIVPEADLYFGVAGDAFEHALLLSLRSQTDVCIVTRIASREAAEALAGDHGAELWDRMFERHMLIVDDPRVEPPYLYVNTWVKPDIGE